MARVPEDHLTPREADVWRATLCGLCASLVGIGLARFAYTPLLPAIIAAGWFDAASAAYLGAANLSGYLAGAFLAGPVALRGGLPRCCVGRCWLPASACSPAPGRPALPGSSPGDLSPGSLEGP